MGDVEHGVADLLLVGVDGIEVAPVGQGHGGSTIIHRVGMAEGVACQDIQAEVEALLQLCREAVAVSLVGVGEVRQSWKAL